MDRSRSIGPVRVAMIAPSLRGGGLERLVRDLTVAVRHEFQISVFCLAGLGLYADDLRALGVAVHDCREPRVRIRGLPMRLMTRLREFRPSLIHAHSGTWYPASVAKTVLRYPRLIYTEHGRYPPEPKVRAYLERWCHRRTDRTVAVSGAVASYLENFLRLPARPSVVENGVELAAYAPSEPGERQRLRAEWGVGAGDVLLMAVGRLAPVKGHDGLLQALATARATAPHLRLAVLGAGPLDRQLREQSVGLGLQDRVRFLGFRTDVARCLNAADCFVNASTTEGLPLSLLEAMASGLPTVATEVGGIPAVLGSPAAGLLVPAGDPNALAIVLARIAGDPELRTVLGARARVRAADYSFDRFVSRYSALYRAVLGGTP